MKRRPILIIVLGLATLAAGGLTACQNPEAEAVGKVADGGTTSEAAEAELKLLSDEEAAGITIETDIVYREVDGTEMLLDVCRDETAAAGDSGDETGGDGESTAGTRPAVLLIHGGGFAHGDKDGRQWQAICRWLAHTGYVAVNVNYRLAPEHPFPAAIEDVQAAVAWTRGNAATLGIDPARIGALGGSAGANLAQLLGASGEGATAEGARIASVISLSGPADLTERGLSLGEPTERQVRRVLDYLGCAEITDCPPAELASPITQVDSTDPPFLLVHSEQERLPVEQTEAMADALTEVGAEPEVLIQPGEAHATRLLRDRPVRQAVLDFLDRTLG